MSHAPILPIVIPFVAAVLCLFAHQQRFAALRRGIAVASALALVAAALELLLQAEDGTIAVYRLGDWPAPYGIVLVVDRLAAMMVALVAILAVPVVLRAIAGTDERGRHFHTLLQLQLAGLNGAFLTGDLFNLFVFFEILLLASYALLLHGGGRERARAGFAYVVLNLAGSALFLIALGLIYGTLGTLNLADLSLALAAVGDADQALVRATAALLVAVFLLKAALLPLCFWLPHAYAAATAPVAVLFAIMTKVGIYALLRVSAIDFAAAPATTGLLDPWLTPLAILTMAAGTVGALAATRLAAVTANLVLVSTGALLAAVASGDPTATAAALYYLPHTTLVTAGLFLLGDAIGGQRGELGDSLVKGSALPRLLVFGGAFLVLGLAVSGVPPMSGFIGKLMLMQSLWATDFGPAIWATLLVSGLLVALVLARAASVFFWEPAREAAATEPSSPPQPQPQPPTGRLALAALAILVAASPLLTLAASPVGAYARAAAAQLHDRQPYVAAVLGAVPDVQRERRP